MYAEETGIQSSFFRRGCERVFTAGNKRGKKAKDHYQQDQQWQYIDFRRMTGRKSQIKCALCGKTIISKEKEEPKEKQRIVEIICGTTYTFDTNDCVLMFKKFRGVYGSDFI